MPRYSKYKPRKKRTYRRRRAVPRKSLALYTQNVGLPKVKKVKMSYHEYVPFVSTSGTSTNAYFNMTSINDPNGSGGGHRPLGHSQWTTFYKDYQVIGAQAKFTFMNVGTNTVPCRVGCLFDEDGSVSSVLSTKVERCGDKKTYILNTNSRERVTITMNFDPKKAFDKKDLMDGHQMTAGLLANPTLLYRAVPWVQSIDSATTSGTVGCDVDITYIVLLKAPIDLLGST